SFFISCRFNVSHDSIISYTTIYNNINFRKSEKNTVLSSGKDGFAKYKVINSGESYFMNAFSLFLFSFLFSFT
ncbi:MAG TPA: hypothetical protein IAA34_03780, partial [Candidatus Enterococcus stercoripullorum]|nr:hypothetical protein [Candidatus Enterococcus stercoripullorum]